MTKPPFPRDFYVAFTLFTFTRLRGEVTEWGNLTDGPHSRTEVLDAISDYFHPKDKPRPSLANVKVFHFRDDAPARDVTEDIINELEAEVAA